MKRRPALSCRRFSLAALASLIILATPLASALALEVQPRQAGWWEQVKDDWDESWDRAWHDEDRDSRLGLSAGLYYPRTRGGNVRFRYEDDRYRQVYIAGDFTDWRDEPMVLDFEEGVWEIHLDLSPGRHHYQFRVEDGEGSWVAFDPSNFESDNLPDHGRVSVLDLDIRRESRRHRRHLDYERIERELNMDYDGRDYTLGATFDYQRVDGLVLGLAPSNIARSDFEPSVRGYLGYGFESDRWSLGLSILQPLVVRNLLWLKLDGYHGTDNAGRTGITDAENLLAMAFFREDFRNHHQREGVAFSLVFAGLDWMRLEGGLRSNDYFSRTNTSSWSFAKGEFAQNLPVDEGTLRAVFGNLRLGTETNFVQVDYERSGEDLLGGFGDYELLEATWRGRLPLGSGQRLDFRVKGGSNLRGSLPLQKRYLLGGLGTVRGYDYQSLLVAHPAGPQALYGGERMAFANVEYGFKLFDSIDLFALYDIGMAYEDREAEIELADMAESVGIGFGIDDACLRVNVFKPLDDGDGDPVVELRLERAF